jgi:hypothetical protein
VATVNSSSLEISHHALLFAIRRGSPTRIPDSPRRLAAELMAFQNGAEGILKGFDSLITRSFFGYHPCGA